MKTIWGLLVIVAFAFTLFSGLFTTITQIQVTNTGLTSESNNLIDKYTIQYEGNLSTAADLGNRVDTNLSSNSTNQVEAFFREQAENKANVNKFKSMLNFLYKIPSLILLTIPFIELGDTALTAYNAIIWLLLGFLILNAAYKAIRTGKTDNE